jgi:23S rRNA pseudouridine1911/1915/1917 synthase
LTVNQGEQSLSVWRWIVDEADSGTRLDRFLTDQEVGITRSQLKKLIEAGQALVGGETARPARKLRPGEQVVLAVPPPEPVALIGDDVPLDVRFEDEFLLVVNKEQGLVVHPAPGHSRGTLVNGLLFRWEVAGGDPLRPGIVHRLDKDTSGLLVVAKREDVHAELARQFHERTVHRQYQVLVAGSPPQSGTWETLYGRAKNDRRRFSSRVSRGKPAVSLFETVERFDRSALLQVTLRTGRTHQVRVHCRDHGLPVLGDRQYTPGRLPQSLQRIHRALPGQALHAGLLGFVHPATREELSFSSDPPAAFCRALDQLRALPGSSGR